MSIDQDPNHHNEDDYDEEADSDFNADDEDISTSSDSENEADDTEAQKPRKRQKISQPAAQDNDMIDLDSGDEATIKEQKKIRRKQKKRGEEVDEDNDNEGAGWRAKTRTMREREKEEKKRNKLANIEGSTIDVDKVWEQMNRSGPLPAVRTESEGPVLATNEDSAADMEQNKENFPALVSEEMVTIKRKFKFAGEIHIEEKTVPKSCAEARLWLAQQEGKPQAIEESGVVTQRPLRKISRFDPNYSNLEAFKANWVRPLGNAEPFNGPKLNVVEKSKMDWASHVDAEGLQDELDEHAKAKEGYHGRMDFLNEVSQRKEEEARRVRMK